MLAGALVLLYLTLSVNALTCALHHGLYGKCHMMGAGHGGMAAGHGMAGMHSGHGDSSPTDMPVRAGVGLCHCLDNLAAEPPAPLLAAAVPPAVPETAPVRVAIPASPPAGPARPRAPPIHPA